MCAKPGGIKSRMAEQISCPSCHHWVASDAQHCSYCGVAISSVQSSSDIVMGQAPPTEPAAFLGPEESERTVVSKGVQHADEFSLYEEENFPTSEQATIQMEGAKASDFYNLPSQVSLEEQLYGVGQDRTQVNLYNESGQAQYSGDMWRTPSQDAWNSPFPQGYEQPVQPPAPRMGLLGPQDAQPTYSGPLDISRAAAADPPERQRNRLLWLLMVLLVAGGIFSLSYVYLLPMLTPKKKTKRKVFVVMELETTPKGAAVWVNGRRQLEPTPTAISVRIGRTVQIQLRKKDHKTVDFQWQATAYDRRRFFLRPLVKPRPRPREVDPPIAAVPTPVRIRPRPRLRRVRRRVRKPKYPTVTLSIRTVPRGAKVRVGSRTWPGRTPLRIVLREGKRSKITVLKYGHQDAYFVWSAKKNEKHTIKLYRHSWYNP